MEKQKQPRFVARTAKYAMDDKGRYYAMTDGSVGRIMSSTDKWKPGNVPVPISCEISPADLSTKVTLNIVSGKPGNEYPIRVEKRDQDGDPFFVYEMGKDQTIMSLIPDRGKWKGTIEEDFVELDDLPTHVQIALLGEGGWNRRQYNRDRLSSLYVGDCEI